MTEVRIFGAHDERTKEQMPRCMQYGSVVGGVLCADGHLGYAQPVGGVIAYEEHISVSGVGFDIACGNMAVKLDVPKAAIEDRVGAILGEIAAKVSFGLGRTNGACLPEEIAAARLASGLQRFDFTTKLFVVVEECEIAAWCKTLSELILYARPSNRGHARMAMQHRSRPQRSRACVPSLSTKSLNTTCRALSG